MLRFSKNYLHINNILSCHVVGWKNFTLQCLKENSIILVNQRYSRQHLNKGLNLNGSHLLIRFMSSEVVVLVRFMNNEVVGYLEPTQNYVIYIYIYIYIYMVHLKLIKNERSIGFNWLLQPYVNKKEMCKKVAQFVGQPSHDIFFSLPKPRPYAITSHLLFKFLLHSKS